MATIASDVAQFVELHRRYKAHELSADELKQYAALREKVQHALNDVPEPVSGAQARPPIKRPRRTP